MFHSIASFSMFFTVRCSSVRHCVIALLLVPAFLFSQKTDTLTPHPSPLTLSQVVIQATRVSASSPVPHSTLSAEKIARQYHAQDVPYLLTGVPSLVETSDAGAGVGYTGLRIRGSDPTRVNVTLNGVPLNDTESQGLFWVDLPDLAASAAEIQVQRGVGTSTNGAGAFGATVNVDLSKVEPEPFANVTNSVGSFGTRKHSAYLGTGLINNRLAFSGRISQIVSDGYVDRASADLNSLHLTGTYLNDRQSVQAHLLSGHERTYQAWYGLPAQYLDQPELRTYNPAGTERSGSPHPDEVDDYTQRHYLLHYKRLISKNLHLQLNGHYTRGFGFYEQYKASEAASDYGLPQWSAGDSAFTENDLVRRRWLDNHFYGSTFALRWQPEMRWSPTFLLGGAASRYEGWHFGEIIWAKRSETFAQGHRYYDNDAAKRDANLFLKTEITPRRGLVAFADLQLRSVGYQFLGFNNNLENVEQTANLLFFNPKLGASWLFSKKWTAYAFAGVAHREPNRDDYTQSTPASRPRPERMLDVETGLKTGGAGWQASANFYWMQYRDQLVLDGRINDVGAYIRTNVPDSRRTGVELEASATLCPRLAVTGNATFSQNKIREFREFVDMWDDGSQQQVTHRNTDLAFSPNTTARAEATWTVFEKKEKSSAFGTQLSTLNSQLLSLSLSSKYVARQFLDNTSNESVSLPRYFFSDLRLNYDWEKANGPKIALILSVNNLFDARYAANGWAYRYISAGYDARPDDPYTRLEGGTTYHQAGFFPQAGRHWMATLRVGF